MGHTPGPWKVEKCDTGYAIYHINGYYTEYIVDTEDEYGEYGTIENENDAHLISAAPDMLEALETIMDIGDKACRDIARVAIQKARGEE